VETIVRSPTDAIAAGIALAPEDRKGDGLVLQMSVGANVSLASLQSIERMMLLSRGAELSLADRYIGQLSIKTPSARQVVRNLSGGNQQKVILGKWMATGPKVLLLDEPTRGIDVNAKREIYRLIDELTEDGLAVVMVSSELPEIMAVADRVLVMCEGRKTADFARGEASEEQILKAALPGTT
jgi:ribose transport system ATP-binding protein